MGSEMPHNLSEEAVAEWLRTLAVLNVQRLPSVPRPLAESHGREGWMLNARAVLALVEAKVREAVDAAARAKYPMMVAEMDEIVARVMGREVRRG